MSLLDAVKQELERLGAKSKRSLGQNFLVNEGVIEKIIYAAKSQNLTNFIEIGPGLGALTEKLISDDHSLRLIELDREFAEKWRRRGIEVIEADALKWDWSSVENKSRVNLVSNLPYQISSSLVIERSLDKEKFANMVLMFQKEVAQRITAEVGSSEYGLLSVIAQSAWRVSKVCDAGPGSFYPQPKVASRVLQFLPNDSQMPPKFLKFVKLCFSHRRKQMKHNLSGLLKDVAWSEVASAVGLDANVRAQQLTVEEFHSLFDWLNAKGLFNAL